MTTCFGADLMSTQHPAFAAFVAKVAFFPAPQTQKIPKQRSKQRAPGTLSLRNLYF